VSLWRLIVTPTRRGTCRRSGQADPSYSGGAWGVSDMRVDWIEGVREQTPDL
jgi:hypothetical protein